MTTFKRFCELGMRVSFLLMIIFGISALYTVIF